MADIDKILNKGNDFLDRAEGKAKERQAMSENPEEEKQGITAKDMAGAGVDYAKDIAANKIQDKVVDKFQEKFLNKDGDSVLKEGAEANKGEEKSAVDDVKNKYLNKNSNSDNLLNDSKNEKGAKSSLIGGKNSSTGGNRGDDVGQTSNGGRKNAFEDSKNPNEKNADNFKKNPTAGVNAAKSGADIAKEEVKEGAKDATKELATGAAPGVGVAEKALAGDAKGAAIKGAGELAGATANTILPGSGGVVKKGVEKGLEEGEKVLKEINGEDTGDKGSNIFAKLGCFGCLGIIGIIVASILFIPTTVVSLNKVIGAAVESATTPIEDFNSFVKDKLTEKLGMDFSDFDFEDIGQDSARMEEYARIQERFIKHRSVEFEAVAENGKILRRVIRKDTGEVISENNNVGTVPLDVNALISDYLSLYSIFAALETVDKPELANELEKYFFTTDDFEIDYAMDIIVEEEMWPNPDYDPEDSSSPEEIEVRVVTLEPVFYLQKAATLSKKIEYNNGYHVDESGNRVEVLNEFEATQSVKWEKGPATITPNYEVIALFNKYKWTKDEISTFEYIADTQHPLNTIFSVGVYGFTSTFTMPVENYVIASEFGDTREPYSADNPNRGIDILADEGTEVKAIAEGTVEDVGNDYITLKIGDNVKVTYSKLRERPSLSKGKSVSKGDIIGYVGDNNLHFEVLNKKGDNINPQTFLASTLPGTSAVFGEGATMKWYHQGQQPSVGGISIADNGCGPTSLAMVLSSPICGSQTVSPAEIAAKAQAAGWWGRPERGYNGADWAMFKGVAAQYGVNNIKQIDNPKSNVDEIHKALSSGYPIIFSISGMNNNGGRYTKFTNYGHFIVADGFYEGEPYVRILDPNYKEADEDHWANFYLDESNKIIDDKTKDGLFTGIRAAWIFYGR